MTLEEIYKTYETLPKIYKWAARDESGHLYLHDLRPVRGISEWRFGGNCFKIDSGNFPEVTWETEPIEVELLIRKVNHK